MITASALKRFCAYPSVLDKVAPRTAAERTREANKKASADRGTRGHKLFEQWCLGQVSRSDDPELQGMLDLLAYQWRPPPTFEGEVAWGLTDSGNYVQVIEVEPHVYWAEPQALDGESLLTAGRADGCWTHGTQRTASRVAQGEPRVPVLDEHEDPMPQPKERQMGAVRGKGDHGLREVAGIPPVLGGLGAHAGAWDDPGAYREREELRTGELSLGNPEGAGSQQGLNSAGAMQWRLDVAGRGRRDLGDELLRSTSAPQSRAPTRESTPAGRPARWSEDATATASTLYVIDHKFGKWPVEPARTNLQVNAAGMALAPRSFCKSYVPGIYYARDGVFDWGEPVEVASKEWRAMFEEIRAAALLDEKPRPGEVCAKCWSRSKCNSAQVSP